MLSSSSRITGRAVRCHAASLPPSSYRPRRDNEPATDTLIGKLAAAGCRTKRRRRNEAAQQDASSLVKAQGIIVLQRIEISRRALVHFGR